MEVTIGKLLDTCPQRLEPSRGRVDAMDFVYVCGLARITETSPCGQFAVALMRTVLD